MSFGNTIRSPRWFRALPVREHDDQAFASKGRLRCCSSFYPGCRLIFIKVLTGFMAHASHPDRQNPRSLFVVAGGAPAMVAASAAATLKTSQPNWNWNQTMKTKVKLVAVFAAFAATAAWAAEPDPHAAHHAAPAAASMPTAKSGTMASPSMMGRSKMDMANMHGVGMSADRLATLKGELTLTPAQLPLWDAFAAAARAMSENMTIHPGMEMPTDKPMMPAAAMPQGAAMPKTGMAMMGAHGSLPDRLDRHEAMMADRLEALRKVKAALSPLYAALSPTQRAKLDAMPPHPHAH